jgi:hypothetical protein
MEEVPLLKTLHDKYSKDAVILGISVDESLARVDRTIKEKGMTWPQFADGKGFDGAIPTASRVGGADRGADQGRARASTGALTFDVANVAAFP